MTERQDELLRKEDWRFHAIDKFNTGLAMTATQEPLLAGGVVGFGLPSAPALFLNTAFAAYRKRACVNVADLFDKHPPPQGTWPENHSPLFDYFETAMLEVICSYSAIEAAANEVIPPDFTYQRRARKGRPPVTLGKDAIERTLSLDEKLKRVLTQALNQSSPAGGKLWPPYLKLKEVRDRLIHLKSIDRKASGPDDETIWGCLLRIGPTIFPNIAADMIGHFYSHNRRWFRFRPKE